MKPTRLKLSIAGAAAMLFCASAFAASPTMNMFGGQAYTGSPNLALTAALIKAGGGADNFSVATALVNMLGEKTVNAEVKKLTKQYDKTKVNNWLKGTDGVVALALKHATAKGISLPQPADLSGADLAKALVKAGVTSDGTFWAGHFYDVLVSHGIHNAVMKDVNTNPKLGAAFDRNVHLISNQAFYDVAQALGMKDVKLASLH